MKHNFKGASPLNLGVPQKTFYQGSQKYFVARNWK